MDRPSLSPTLVRAARLLVIVLFAAWAWQGPVRYRLLKDKRVSWSYIFFRAQSSGACDVRYYEATDGGLRYIERWKVFGYDTPGDMPRRLRTVGPADSIVAHTAKFCSLLTEQRGQPVDVRAQVNCPNWDNWTSVETGDRNVCDPKELRKARKALRDKKRKKREKKKRRADKPASKGAKK